jgi:hypothetical protein
MGASCELCCDDTNMAAVDFFVSFFDNSTLAEPRSTMR